MHLQREAETEVERASQKAVKGLSWPIFGHAWAFLGRLRLLSSLILSCLGPILGMSWLVLGCFQHMLGRLETRVSHCWNLFVKPILWKLCGASLVKLELILWPQSRQFRDQFCIQFEFHSGMELAVAAAVTISWTTKATGAAVVMAAMLPSACKESLAHAALTCLALSNRSSLLLPPMPPPPYFIASVATAAASTSVGGRRGNGGTRQSDKG